MAGGASDDCLPPLVLAGSPVSACLRVASSSPCLSALTGVPFTGLGSA